MHGRHLSRWLRWLKLGFALALPLVAGTAALACRPRHCFFVRRSARCRSAPRVAGNGWRTWKVCRSVERAKDQTDPPCFLSRSQRTWRQSFTSHSAPHTRNMGHAARRRPAVGSDWPPWDEPQDLAEVRQALARFSEARSRGVMSDNICAETVPSVLEIPVNNGLPR